MVRWGCCDPSMLLEALGRIEARSESYGDVAEDTGMEERASAAEEEEGSGGEEEGHSRAGQASKRKRRREREASLTGSHTPHTVWRGHTGPT